MSHPDAPNPTPEKLLADVIANHFTGAQVIDNDGAQIVRLGEGLPEIECYINSMQETPPHGVFITLKIWGGVLGSTGALVTASGYGDDMYQALVSAGCTWACAFGPVLLTALGRADLITTHEPDVEQFEIALQGRRYLVTMGHLDRSISMPLDQVQAYRRELGGTRALTAKVLASGAIPATRGDDIVPLGCFLGAGPDRIAEVKLGADDWEPGRMVLVEGPTHPYGIRMLREWALLKPLEPAPGLTRDGLQRVLDLLKTASGSSRSEAGWLGGRSHGMRLGAPGFTDDVALPGDARRFVDEIAASGAGPGYGLDLYPITDGWLHLAQAGCGAQWALDLTDGSVALDTRPCDGQFRRVAPGFTAWYEAWLDNAILGGGPYEQWDYSSDAAFGLLAQAMEEHGLDKLPDVGLELKLRSPQGELVGPCHGCESAYARYGVSSSAFVMTE
jgi:hypothetical protein avisC_10765